MLSTETNRWPNFIIVITIFHNSLFSIAHKKFCWGFILIKYAYLYYTLDVAMTFSVVQWTQFSCSLTFFRMCYENWSSSLTLSTNNTTHSDNLEIQSNGIVSKLKNLRKSMQCVTSYDFTGTTKSKHYKLYWCRKKWKIFHEIIFKSQKFTFTAKVNATKSVLKIVFDADGQNYWWIFSILFSGDFISVRTECS